MVTIQRLAYTDSAEGRRLSASSSNPKYKLANRAAIESYDLDPPPLGDRWKASQYQLRVLKS